MGQTQEYLVKTSRSSCTVQINLQADSDDMPLYVVGYDPLNANTLYFRSRFYINGKETITLNCPQSPITLHLVIWTEDNYSFRSCSVQLLPLSVPEIADPEILFIERFARRAGRLRKGIYSADNVEFKIHLLGAIYTDTGAIHPTPARIHTELPIIQVSKIKFDQMTIPERVIILLHEVAHNYINLNPDNEGEADDHAKEIYNTIGYPQIESVNAFADIMPDTDGNYERMQNLVNL